MQGSYKNNGLPRPYYMKPHSKRTKAYEKMPRQFFLTNSRKLSGYIVMLFFFGLCIYMISQELKEKPDIAYELVDPLEKQSDNNGDVGKLVDSSKMEDRADEKVALASKEQNIVVEAPKGGSVNEGPIVGNDEGLVVDGKPSNNKNAGKIGAGSVQAARGDQIAPPGEPSNDRDLSKLLEISEDAQNPGGVPRGDSEKKI
ncbi:hypothetical protein CA3LBN_000549 [Candidozyma haemuli]|uniref:Uncharacterized protein n=2 Tax=Candidozyma TaxID=3303203 RepID=A0ABX8HZS8_9ASCO|nr:hypothetical protein CA3LBN_000549 [[Candida] haemuloni]